MILGGLKVVNMSLKKVVEAFYKANSPVGDTIAYPDDVDFSGKVYTKVVVQKNLFLIFINSGDVEFNVGLNPVYSDEEYYAHENMKALTMRLVSFFDSPGIAGGVLKGLMGEGIVCEVQAGGQLIVSAINSKAPSSEEAEKPVEGFITGETIARIEPKVGQVEESQEATVEVIEDAEFTEIPNLESSVVNDSSSNTDTPKTDQFADLYDGFTQDIDLDQQVNR